jgi:hypothetical protein
MPKFLTFHVEPERRWEELVEKYRRLAVETTAVWVRTYLYEGCSHRICEWDAPGAQTLESLFARLDMACDRIVEVKEVLPSQWR